MSDPLAHLVQPTEPLVPQGSPASEAALTVQLPAAPMLAAGNLNDAAKQTFLWNVHSYLGEYARFADTKAAFAGTLAAALIGALYGAKLYEKIFSARPSAWAAGNWLTLAASVFLVAAVGLAIRTVYPRLRRAPGEGFIFWGNLTAFQTLEALQASFSTQSAATLNDLLLRQNYTVARYVCTPKYRNVSLALISLTLGALLASAALLLKR